MAVKYEYKINLTINTVQVLRVLNIVKNLPNQ